MVAQAHHNKRTRWFGCVRLRLSRSRSRLVGTRRIRVYGCLLAWEGKARNAGRGWGGLNIYLEEGKVDRSGHQAGFG